MIGSRSFASTRLLRERYFFELKRVYGLQSIPNTALRELIRANKTMYPKAFSK